MTFRVEGGIVVGARPNDAAALEDLKLDFDTDVPKYRWSDMKIFDKTKCSTPLSPAVWYKSYQIWITSNQVSYLQYKEIIML